MKTPTWPTHPDGKPRTMGELTKEEQYLQFRAAIKRLQPQFAREGIKLICAKDLN